MPHNPVALIVEDRPEVSTMWANYLKDLNLQVRIAPNLASAKLLSKEIPPPDLIILDLRLPDAHDVDTLASIKELTAPNPDCAVLVISGFLTPALTKLALEQGAHSAMEKMDVTRGIDFWGGIKKMLENSPKNIGKRLKETGDLIERLSAKASLL